MKIGHLDVGVRRALRAYKLEQGLSEAAADAFADAKLADGVARVQAFVDQRKSLEEAVLAAAFADLKTWAK